MIDINKWLELYIKVIKESFSNRIVFIGLQGSYARNEASENSDIDVVLILDNLDINDLNIYKSAISKLPYTDLICGFISGRNEILNWDKSQLFQFCYDTIPIFNDLDFLFKLISKQDIRQSILSESCNVYHICVHNFVHECSFDILKSIYKNVSFILQAKYFYENNTYIKDKYTLSNNLNGLDRLILKDYVHLKSLKDVCNADFKNLSKRVLDWSSQTIRDYSM